MAGRPRLPRGVRVIFLALLPIAEREEVVTEVEAEFARRAGADGRAAARRWAWRQALGSVPSLLRRGWWRGMSGFEPHANRLRPGGPMFESWIMDMRFALRHLLRRPVYAAAAIATLALGAGGMAATYSITDAVLRDPLPMAREDQVGVLWFGGSWTEEEFLGLRPSFPGFQGMAAYRPGDLTLEMPGVPLRLIPAVAVSSELFDVLGTPPLIGRTFGRGEDLAGAEPLVVLSHRLWQDVGGNPRIIGQSLRLGGIPRRVIGVMPPGFWFPSPATRMWTAAPMDPANRSGQYTLVGRVADGHSVAEMHGPLQSLAATLGERFRYPTPQWDKTRNPSITGAREFFIGDVRRAVIAMFAAMALILLIAGANVTALLLGQVEARDTEIGVRAALGATRRRLIQQLIAESLVLGAIAGAAGAMFATGAFTVLVGALPLGDLRETIGLDWSVFWASMLTAVGAALLVALIAGAALWRIGNPQSALSTTRGGGAGARTPVESLLVVGQMALAVLLAAGAGLLIRSTVNLRALDAGVDIERAVVIDTVSVRLTPDERKRGVQELLRVLRALPGVRVAAAAQKLPLRGSGDNWGLTIRGRGDPQATTAFRMVTHDYFAAIGMTIRRGRGFSPADQPGTERVIVVNEALAAKFFPDDDPIGQVLTSVDQTGERIIGVVSNAAEASLPDGAVPARYVLYDQMPFLYTQVTFVLRSDRDELIPLLQGARETIERESRLFAVQQTTTLRNIFDVAVGPVAHVMTLVVSLTLLALFLGAVGVYGVVAHFVQRRSKEFAIRLAVGQSPGHIVRQILGRSVKLVALGSAIGLALVLAAGNLMTSMLFGVEARDPLSLFGAVAALLVIGTVAAIVPARRAGLTDPATTLREG